MAEVTAGYVARGRLVGRLLAGRVGLVEAGAGFGKSVLASQFRRALGVATVYVLLGPPDRDPAVLVSSFRRALRIARLSDLLSATDVAEPVGWIDRLLDALVVSEAGVLVVLDDAHHLGGDDGGALVMRLACGLPERHRLLIAARSLVGSLEGLWALEGAVRLDTSALAFTTEEAAELIGYRLGRPPRAHDVRLLVEATQGWATALVLAAQGYGTDGAQVLALSSGSGLIASWLRGILGALGPGDRRALVQLAHLPFLSPELCDLVSGSDGSFARIVAVGIPIARSESGWWELPSPVAACLVSQAPLADATVQAAADVYSRHGEVLSATRALLAAGLASQAAAALAEVPLDRVEDLGLAVIRDLVERLPELAIRSHPRVLLHLARVAEAAHQAELRAEMLANASGLLPADGRGADAALGRELDAERARDLLWDERTRKEARALAVSVIDQAGEEEVVARARALDVLGRLASRDRRRTIRRAALPTARAPARLTRPCRISTRSTTASQDRARRARTLRLSQARGPRASASRKPPRLITGCT
jgi:ATP/maltotriose-dependent transcriptional regulator MalT